MRLDLAALNRATLARQHLLARATDGPLSVIERLVGMQGQLARPPFLRLWARVAGFRAEELRGLLRDRAVVRATMMRCTLHLVSARDFLAFRPVLDDVLHRAMAGVLRARADELDLERLVAEARAFFRERPRPFEDLREHLTALHPGGDERAMAYAVRTHLPFVHVPTDAPWGFPAQADVAVAEDWLGPLGTGDGPDALALRWLAAFGPGTPADFQAWSGLRGAAAVFRRLRDRLVELEDDAGRTLYDLPDAPRPDRDTPAPVRLLGEFDDLLLGHADRRRIVADEHRPAVVTKNLQVLAVVLVDGFVAGTWKVERRTSRATLVVSPFRDPSATTRDAIVGEGEELLAFADPDARAREVRFG